MFVADNKMLPIEVTYVLDQTVHNEYKKMQTRRRSKQANKYESRTNYGPAVSLTENENTKLKVYVCGTVGAHRIELMVMCCLPH